MALRCSIALLISCIATGHMPHTTTRKTPAELFLKRQVRTRLSLVKPGESPSFHTGSVPKQSEMKKKVWSFSMCQAVLVKNYRGGEKWLNGVITDVLGSVTYLLSVNGTCLKRHVNQMLGAKKKNGIPEKTVSNTEGNCDYHIDPGEDMSYNDTVHAVCGAPENRQSSVETDRALENTSSSGCMERPKGMCALLNVWTYRKTIRKRLCTKSLA